MTFENLISFIFGYCIGFIVIFFFEKYVKIAIYTIWAAICWLFAFGSIPIYVKFRLNKDPKGSFRYIKFNKL